VVLGREIIGLNDSKQVSEAERERLFDEIRCGPHSVSVTIIGADVIDARGIQAANYAAMAGAAAGLWPAPDLLLVDGFPIRGCAITQTAIVKGDGRSVSIAAASIVAKVTRDHIMVNLGREYPHYGFERHKGYATREHLAALERYGPCPAHRKSFAPIATRADSGLLC
jgi:ribonuclease HII